MVTIDSLRGYLAIAVYIHHASITWFYLQRGKWELPPSKLLANSGECAVALFFMVTGFLFWGRVLEQGKRFDWFGFFLSRMARLVPLFYTVVAVLVASTFLLAGGYIVESPLIFARHIVHWLLFTFSQTSDLNGVNATWRMIAGVQWTLTYEWLFYFVLPVAALLTLKSKNVFAASVGLCVMLIAWHLGWPDAKILALFAGGVAGAHWVRVPQLAGLAKTSAFGVFGVFCFALTLLTDVPESIGLPVFFVAVASGNTMWGALRARAAVWLGEVSYSIYLLHGLTLWVLFSSPLFHAQWRNVSIELYVVAIILNTFVVVAIASVTCVTVEWPGIRAGRVLCKKWRDFRQLRLQAEPVQ
ncbi:acyltransferase [Niveibacterium umoris]